MTDKPKCPNCEVEITPTEGQETTKCAKCGFPLASYPGFKLMMKRFLAELKEENKGKPASKGKGFFDILGEL